MGFRGIRIYGVFKGLFPEERRVEAAPEGAASAALLYCLLHRY